MASRDPDEKLYQVPRMANTDSTMSSDDADLSRHPTELQVLEQHRGVRGFYYNPTVQVVMLGFVCFMCPGLFNSLQGLGGGGQLNEGTSANANSALYSTFAFFAFFAGYAFHFLLRRSQPPAHGYMSPSPAQVHQQRPRVQANTTAWKCRLRGLHQLVPVSFILWHLPKAALTESPSLPPPLRLTDAHNVAPLIHLTLPVS